MSVLNFLKSGAAQAIPPNELRCQHHYANRSRCTKSIAAGSEFFCRHHINTGRLANSIRTREEREAQLIALRAEIMGQLAALDSATAVNHVLGKLFCVYLEGRISQTKVAQLTSVCRSLLSSIRLKRDELAAADFKKCFFDLTNPQRHQPPDRESTQDSQPQSESEPQSAGNATVAKFSQDSKEEQQITSAAIPHSDETHSAELETSTAEDHAEYGHSANVASAPACTETGEGGRMCAAIPTASDNSPTANSVEEQNSEGAPFSAPRGEAASEGRKWGFSPDSSRAKDPEPPENSQEPAAPTTHPDSAEEVSTSADPDPISLDPQPCPPSTFGPAALRRKRRR
jgi:hypothetical protein